MHDERPTAAFRAEHAELRQHLAHVQDWVGAPNLDMQKVLAFFERHILPHAEWEAQRLYPVVDRLAGSGMEPFTASLRLEHQVVARWIAELRGAAARGDTRFFSRRADHLLGLLWAHFEAEEEVLLPLVDEQLSREQFEREVGTH